MALKRIQMLDVKELIRLTDGEKRQAAQLATNAPGASSAAED